MENIEIKNIGTEMLGEPQMQRRLFSIVILFNIIFAAILISSPVTSIKGSEANVIYTIQATMLNKNAMYSDPETFPFCATQYNPLYYIVTSTAASLLYFTPGDDVVAIYRVSRFISFLASIAVTYFIFLILTNVFRLKRDWSLWLAVTSVICTIPWYYALRPDSLMALFFFGSLYYFLMSITQPEKATRFLLLSGFLAAISFFSKQNGLIIALTIGSYLVFTLRLKNILLFSFGFLLGGGFMAMLFTPYYSAFFFKNIFQGLNNGIDLQQAITVSYFGFASRFGFLAVLALISILMIYSKRSWRFIPSQYNFLIFMLFVLLPFSALTALKIGSDINYFNEVICVLFLVLGASASLVKNVYDNQHNQWLNASLFILVFAVAVSVSIAAFLEVGLRNIKRMSEKDDVYNAEMISFLREEAKQNKIPLMILSDYPFVNNALPKNCLVPQPDISLLWYYRNVYDFAELKKSIEDGRIQYYAGNGFLLKCFSIDTDRDFKLMRRFDKYDLYVNKHIGH
jgi:hypothetical protein